MKLILFKNVILLREEFGIFIKNYFSPESKEIATESQGLKSGLITHFIEETKLKHMLNFDHACFTNEPKHRKYFTQIACNKCQSSFICIKERWDYERIR